MLRLLALAAALAACSAPPEPAAAQSPTQPAKDAAMSSPPPESELRTRLRRDFESQTKMPRAASPPVREGSMWRSPSGKPITEVFVVARNRPAEQDGVAKTLYYCAEEQTYWVFEGGGISGISRWYGPFALR